jgi:hypothetical protein
VPAGGGAACHAGAQVAAGVVAPDQPQFGRVPCSCLVVEHHGRTPTWPARSGRTGPVRGRGGSGVSRQHVGGWAMAQRVARGTGDGVGPGFQGASERVSCDGGVRVAGAARAVGSGRVRRHREGGGRRRGVRGTGRWSGARIRAVIASLLPFHGCRSGTGADRAPPDACCSSSASVSCGVPETLAARRNQQRVQSGVAAGLEAGLEVLEPGAGSRHPPAEFLASPGTLARIGVDDGAVAEDPAVHHEA